MATLLQRYHVVDQEIKALEKIKKDLRTEIGELGIGSVPIDDDYRMSVTATRKFDPAIAKDLLSEDDYQRILKTTPDITLAKRVMAPEILDLAYVTTGETWKVVKRDD